LARLAEAAKSEMNGRIEIFADPAALARHAAEWMTAAALAATGVFRVSLSGGSTPKTLYALLASDEFRGRFSLDASLLVLGR
jgi:6-phosphogluconolactonase